MQSVLEGQVLSKNSRMTSSQLFLFVVFLIHISMYLSYLSSLCYLCSFTFYVSFREIPYGLAVGIPGFHPGGSGSTPGMGTHFLSVQLNYVFISHSG